MKLTTNLSLKKPDYTDAVDIMDINANMDAIDYYLKNNIPNLVNYQYILTAEIEGQRDFPIPLDTFNKGTDTVILSQNRGMLATDDYFILDNSIRLVEGVTKGTTLFLTIFKNVPVEKGSKLIAGDLMAGYYGKVDGLITGTDLSTEVGFTAGTLAHSGDITWLKFSHNYKTLLISDRGIRNSISWDDIQAQDLVKGKVIEIRGKLYLCRLMTGGNSNPSSEAGGEWDDLIIRFTPNESDSNWYNRSTWCQEIYNDRIGSRTVMAGRLGDVTTYGGFSASDTTWSCWRPVLELL